MIGSCTINHATRPRPSRDGYATQKEESKLGATTKSQGPSLPAMATERDARAWMALATELGSRASLKDPRPSEPHETRRILHAHDSTRVAQDADAWATAAEIRRNAAMPPQIEPPRGCACGASLGKLLRRRRHENRALANHWLSAGTSGNATALLLYAFTSSGELPDGSMTAQVHYAGTRLRRHLPGLPEPVLSSSMGSLSRVTSTMGSRVSFMACPSLQHIVGRSGVVPAIDDVVPCDPPPAGLVASGPLACFTVAMMAVQVAMLHRAALTPGIRRALIVETDMLWLGHPIAMYARWRHHRFPVVWDGGKGTGGARSAPPPRASPSPVLPTPEPISLDDCDVRATAAAAGPCSTVPICIYNAAVQARLSVPSLPWPAYHLGLARVRTTAPRHDPHSPLSYDPHSPLSYDPHSPLPLSPFAPFLASIRSFPCSHSPFADRPDHTCRGRPQLRSPGD